MNNTLKIRIVIELVHGMNFIHKQGLIHRDLKIDNIRLNSVYESKIIDLIILLTFNPYKISKAFSNINKASKIVAILIFEIGK